MKVLITGTTRGIGQMVYKRLVLHHHDVYTINRSLEDNSRNFCCDLSNIIEVENLCSTIASYDWDALINNAGGDSPYDFSNMTSDIILNSMILNYVSPVLLMHAVIPIMEKKHYGKIINISSIASKSPRPFLAHYGASKSALESFSKSLAVQYISKGITINCICPGGINTDQSRENRRKLSKIMGLPDDSREKSFLNQNGRTELMEPDVIADYIEYLLSSSGDYISGQCINICGVSEVH